MAVMLRQCGSGNNSISLEIDGIVSARQTYIYIWQLGQWLTIGDARDAGYITFETDGSVNGRITVYFDNACNTDYYKIWDFYCADVGETVRETQVLHALVGFSYENAQIKATGEVVDITWKDMDNIYLYAMWAMYCIQNENMDDFRRFTGNDIGTNIKAKYLRNFFDVLYDVFFGVVYYGIQPNTYMQNIDDLEYLFGLEFMKCNKGDDLEALFFHDCIYLLLHKFQMEVYSSE